MLEACAGAAPEHDGCREEVISAEMIASREPTINVGCNVSHVKTRAIKKGPYSE
jgi:hypothetical protein